MKIGIIDYGVGNLASVHRALQELKAVPVLITHPDQISSVDKLILPGVGNFSDCAARLKTNDWFTALQHQTKPLLGICVGMQLLASMSTEGSECDGLNLISGRVEHLSQLGCQLRLPHVGWNEVDLCQPADVLFNGIATGVDFYFVHSYAFVPTNKQHVIATTDYGVAVTAAVRQEHIWGTQFHPEKSSRAGFTVLNNFVQC